MCGQQWCIGSWVGVIGSLNAGLHHAGCVLHFSNKVSLLHLHFQWFGLLMHVSTMATFSSKGSESKTEAMYFPSKQLKDIPQDELAADKADFDLTCKGGGNITLMDDFCYHGSLISLDLTDNSDV